MKYFILFFIFSSLIPALCYSASTLSETESLKMSSNRTIVSENFELGFFTFGNRSYLGIWYRRLPTRTYVWVANKETPLFNSSGELKFAENNLVLLNQRQNQVWSTTTVIGAKATAVAELLDNGNFVVKDGTNQTVWQSFDHPTNTFLPGMVITFDTVLISWKSPDNPSDGSFRLTMERSPRKEFILQQTLGVSFRSPLWNNQNSIPNIVVKNMTGTTYEGENNSISSIRLSDKGVLEQLMWNESSHKWNLLWYAPKGRCDRYNICGADSYCDSVTSQCMCLRGFRRVHEGIEYTVGDKEDGRGCVRKSNLTCSEDEFVRLPNVILPDAFETISLDAGGPGITRCQRTCLSNCECLAFAIFEFYDSRSCINWIRLPLIDLKTYVQGAKGGIDLYVRVAPTGNRHLEEQRKRMTRIISLSVEGGGLVALIIFVIRCLLKRRAIGNFVTLNSINERVDIAGIGANVQISNQRQLLVNDTELTRLPLLKLDILFEATDGFSDSNKLGKGGFGYVYKGRLPDGQEVAVKRLGKESGQGSTEFINEVNLISRLRHRNLVRLVGCWIDDNEKILVYEYLENGSLKDNIFGRRQTRHLDWETRSKIVIGIARGILYIHQDTEQKVLHRDLKLDNVLLDKDMNPKISDFGLAKSSPRDMTEVIESRPVGTQGYISPEYQKYGKMTTKLDVFSFGVMVVEIVTGKSNSRRMTDADEGISHIVHVWNKWMQRRALETVDPFLTTDAPSSSSSTPPSQEHILRYLHIGLLCAQHSPNKRPEMSLVLTMLDSENMPLLPPSEPGFAIQSSPIGLQPVLVTDVNDVNELTITELEPR